MKTKAFTGRADYPEIVTAPGELVRVEEALVFLPQMEQQQAAPPHRPMHTWVRWFLLAAALGVTGGFAAALLVNTPETPRFRSMPPSSSSLESSLGGRHIDRPVAETLPPRISTTTVTVEAPPAGHHAAARNPSEEVTRLKTRNRRLEALVRVLRQRDKEPDRVRSGRN